MPQTSSDRQESRRGSEIDLPLSTSTSRTASMEEASISSLDPQDSGHQSRWPRTWRAYACWLGCFFLMFNSWGLVNAYGTFASYYVGHSLRNEDQLKLNLIGSTQSALVLFFSLPVGRLLDAGLFRYVIGTGTFLVPFGMFMLSVAHPVGEDALANFGTIWVTQGLVAGLGMACYFVTSSQVAATWFPRHKGLAVGVVACGASVAGVIYPTMARYLIEAMGFNNACRIVATLVTVTSIFSLVFATPNPSHFHPKPKRWFSRSVWIDSDAFQNAAFWWFTASVAFLFLGFYPVFFNIEEWAAVNGYGTRDGSGVPIVEVDPSNKPLETFWLLSIMNGASTVGRLTMATFSDKTGQLNMHIVSQIISSLLCMVLWSLAGSTTAAIAFCVIFGMTSGAVIGLPPASMANILSCTYNTPENKHLAHAKLGHWTGTMYSFAFLPALVGPLIAGHLITTFDTYLTVQLWSGGCLMVSALCMIMTRWCLPCADGELVKDKIKKFIGQRRQPRKVSTADTANTYPLSRATTRIGSEAVSPQASKEKVNDQAPEAGGSRPNA